MESSLNILLNKAIQKFVKLAKCARENQMYGESSDIEFCELTKLWSVIWTIENTPDLIDYCKFRDLEKIVNQIGGRDELNYRPIIYQDVQGPTVDCCDTISELWNLVTNIKKDINYIPPTLQLISTIEENVFEVGHQDFNVNIDWLANKLPLNNIRINLPNGIQQISPNLSGRINDVLINLRTSNAVTRTIYGWYNDKETYQNVHQLAEAKLTYKTVWPCYYGVGSENLLSNSQTIVQSIHGLNKALECPKCFHEVLNEGEYFYYFYKYDGVKKQFKTENGAIAFSFKGTVDNFRTESMIVNGINETVQYGVIRFDQPAILGVNLCVVNMLNDDIVEIEYPEIIPNEPIEPEIPAINEVIYISNWSQLICNKE